MYFVVCKNSIEVKDERFDGVGKLFSSVPCFLVAKKFFGDRQISRAVDLDRTFLRNFVRGNLPEKAVFRLLKSLPIHNVNPTGLLKLLFALLSSLTLIGIVIDTRKATILIFTP